VTQVDYSKPASIKSALSGVDVVISTISAVFSLDVQEKIAEAAKEVGVKLFIPSDFGNATEGMFREKAAFRTQLKKLGVPYAVFYAGEFADYIWEPCVCRLLFLFSYVEVETTDQRFLDLDVKGGKVKVAGDGNKVISFTSRTDTARYLSYVLTRLPPDQLKNRPFFIEGEHKVRPASESYIFYDQQTVTAAI
jgi:bisphosphoglycerate-independent phosphoglycerate mutase (AlkP superfamily)